jgi:hypothetical protein
MHKNLELNWNIKFKKDQLNEVVKFYGVFLDLFSDKSVNYLNAETYRKVCGKNLTKSFAKFNKLVCYVDENLFSKLQNRY